jgi:hypothetical protein
VDVGLFSCRRKSTQKILSRFRESRQTPRTTSRHIWKLVWGWNKPEVTGRRWRTRNKRRRFAPQQHGRGRDGGGGKDPRCRRYCQSSASSRHCWARWGGSPPSPRIHRASILRTTPPPPTSMPMAPPAPQVAQHTPREPSALRPRDAPPRRPPATPDIISPRAERSPPLEAPDGGGWIFRRRGKHQTTPPPPPRLATTRLLRGTTRADPIGRPSAEATVIAMPCLRRRTNMAGGPAYSRPRGGGQRRAS